MQHQRSSRGGGPTSFVDCLMPRCAPTADVSCPAAAALTSGTRMVCRSCCFRKRSRSGREGTAQGGTRSGQWDCGAFLHPLARCQTECSRVALGTFLPAQQRPPICRCRPLPAFKHLEQHGRVPASCGRASHLCPQCAAGSCHPRPARNRPLSAGCVGGSGLLRRPPATIIGCLGLQCTVPGTQAMQTELPAATARQPPPKAAGGGSAVLLETHSRPAAGSSL